MCMYLHVLGKEGVGCLSTEHSDLGSAGCWDGTLGIPTTSIDLRRFDSKMSIPPSFLLKFSF